MYLITSYGQYQGNKKSLYYINMVSYFDYSHFLQIQNGNEFLQRPCLSDSIFT